MHLRPHDGQIRDPAILNHLFGHMQRNTTGLYAALFPWVYCARPNWIAPSLAPGLTSSLRLDLSLNRIIILAQAQAQAQVSASVPAPVSAST